MRNEPRIKALLSVDSVAVETGDEVTVLLEVTAPATPEAEDATERPPACFIVVLDRSGSMAGAALEAAKSALVETVNRLEPTDLFGLVVFDDQAQIVVPAASLTDKASVRRAILRIDSGGSTDLGGGYLLGLQEAHRVAGPTGATILIVSDGHANAGLTDPDQLGGIARAGVEKAIVTATLGLGLGYDEALLAAIATAGGGNHAFAEGPDQASLLISAEAAGLVAKTIQGATLEIGCSGDVAVIEVMNENPSHAIEGGVLVEVGDLFSAETRKLMVRLTVPSIGALGLAQVATLTLRYTVLAALSHETVTIPISVNVVPADVAADRVPHPVVEAESAYLEAQRAKRAATGALMQGDITGASASLLAACDRIDRVREGATAAQRKDLDEEREMLSMLAEEVHHDGNRTSKRLNSQMSRRSSKRGRREWFEAQGVEMPEE